MRIFIDFYVSDYAVVGCLLILYFLIAFCGVYGKILNFIYMEFFRNYNENV